MVAHWQESKELTPLDIVASGIHRYILDRVDELKRSHPKRSINENVVLKITALEKLYWEAYDEFGTTKKQRRANSLAREALTQQIGDIGQVNGDRPQEMLANTRFSLDLYNNRLFAEAYRWPSLEEIKSRLILFPNWNSLSFNDLIVRLLPDYIMADGFTLKRLW